jgi:hypothetical protein
MNDVREKKKKKKKKGKENKELIQEAKIGCYFCSKIGNGKQYKKVCFDFLFY